MSADTTPAAGCSVCGAQRDGHGLAVIPGRSVHGWTAPLPAGRARGFWGRWRAAGTGERRASAAADLQQEIRRLTALLTTQGAAVATLTHDLTQAGLRVTRLEDEQEQDADAMANLRGLLAVKYRNLHQTAFTLGDVFVWLLLEQAAHAETRRQLDVAVRANESNVNAKTVVTDVSVLRAGDADEYVDLPTRGPEFAPYTRVVPLAEALGATA